MTGQRILRDYQVEAVANVEAAWANGERTSVVMPTGSGKPLSDDTEIPTVGGFVRMGDIRVGHYVFGADGRPARVMGVYPQGEIPLYRVEFDDHSSLLAGAEHLWTVQRKGRKPRTVTTEWIARQPMIDRDGYLWRLPVMDAAQFTERGLPLDPYLAGSLIANGHVVHGRAAKLTTPDDAVVQNIRNRGINIQPAYVAPGACPAYTFPGLSHTITRAGIRGALAADKRIPEVFKVAAQQDRLNLLRGMMDGDGSTRSGGRRSIIYHTTSEGLAEDVAELVWSLGGRALISKSDRSHDDKPTEYDVQILPPVGVSFFATPRRDRDEQPRRQFGPRRSIVSITYAGSGLATCIQVDNDRGLFAAGRRYVVTHNTTVIGTVAARAYQRGERVVMVAHRAELLDQMATTVAQCDHSIPMHEIGIVRGAKDDSEATIIAATLQTLANSQRLQSILPRGVVLVDECHHAGAKTYHDVMAELGAFTGQAKLCGFTATMHRDAKQGIALTDVFETIAFERDLAWAIDQGFLVEPYGIVAHTDALDALDNLRLLAGDYGPKQLAAVMEASATIQFVTAAIHEYARDRRSIVFAASVHQAEMLRGTLQAVGITSAWVNGTMAYSKRLPTYERFRRGEIQALINVGILTEGADFPMCDAVVLARPTRSMNLYTQMCGRALRLHPGKTDALVLDISGRGDGVVSLNDLRDGVTINHVGREEEPTERGDGGPRERVEREEFTLELTPGGMSTREFHLLPGRASKRYRQTKGGVLFVDTHQERRAVILAKDGDDWRVGTADTRTGRVVLSDVRLGFDEADKVAEIAAGQLGGVRNKMRSSAQPTDPQVAFAGGLGIEAEGMNRGQLSDAITTQLVSRVVDAQMARNVS